MFNDRIALEHHGVHPQPDKKAHCFDHRGKVFWFVNAANITEEKTIRVNNRICESKTQEDGKRVERRKMQTTTRY